MNWPDGHEKMVTFGVALAVRGKASGVWCYRSAPLTAKYSNLLRLSDDVGRRAQPIIEYLNDRRADLAAQEGSQGKCHRAFQ